MKKNYEKLFKIEPLDNSIFNYTVYRPNFFGKFKKVATVKIIPGERAEITFLKALSLSQEEYLEKHFLDLANLKIELDLSNKHYDIYNVYRRSSSNEQKKVAVATCYEIIALESLKSHEASYLSRYFRYMFNKESIPS